MEAIATASALYAAEQLQSPVVTSDIGFYIPALNGFPGPYAAYVEHVLDHTDILNMMAVKEERRAFYREVLCFCDGRPGHDPTVRLVSAITEGILATTPSGSHGYNFDQIFIRQGDDGTMAHLVDSERAIGYSGEHWKELKTFIESNFPLS